MTKQTSKTNQSRLPKVGDIVYSIEFNKPVYFRVTKVSEKKMKIAAILKDGSCTKQQWSCQLSVEDGKLAMFNSTYYILRFADNAWNRKDLEQLNQTLFIA